jgi:hypothetical protein
MGARVARRVKKALRTDELHDATVSLNGWWLFVLVDFEAARYTTS